MAMTRGIWLPFKAPIVLRTPWLENASSIWRRRSVEGTTTRVRRAEAKNGRDMAIAVFPTPVGIATVAGISGFTDQ
jgi:hypothetical protein